MKISIENKIIKTSISMPRHVYLQFKELSKKQNRTFSNMLSLVVSASIEKSNPQWDLTPQNFLENKKDENHLSNSSYEVYFIKDLKSKLTKIGISKSLNERLLAIKSHNPSAVLVKKINGTRRLESALHKAFAKKRVYAEWFDLTDNDIALAVDLVEKTFDPSDASFDFYLLIEKIKDAACP